MSALDRAIDDLQTAVDLLRGERDTLQARVDLALTWIRKDSPDDAVWRVREILDGTATPEDIARWEAESEARKANRAV